MTDEVKEETLLVVRPLVFRGEPVGFVAGVMLIFAFGIGLLLLLIWWLQCRFTSYEVTNLRVIEQIGVLSRRTNEVRHVDVRNVTVNQSIFQRLFGTGSVGISTAGQSDIEMVVKNIRDPDKVVEIIRKHQG